MVVNQTLSKIPYYVSSLFGCEVFDENGHGKILTVGEMIEDVIGNQEIEHVKFNMDGTRLQFGHIWTTKMVYVIEPSFIIVGEIDIRGLPRNPEV